MSRAARVASTRPAVIVAFTAINELIGIALAENKDAAFAFRYNNRENVDIFDPAIARC